MALEIVSGVPGLWRDPQWAPAMPGVYALIAGVSAYPHLEGGAAPAPETHQLEQLLSSAATAAALFEWLRTSFRREELPVVWCYLLLSPTAAERAAFDAVGLSHYATPDYAGLQLAIQCWTGNVPSQPPASRKSRTLFFFSGHGVQANWSPLLLPSDYLNPALGQPHLENCISARELRKWMEENPVAEHLAFIDACRNEFSPLAAKGASAHSVFPTTPPGGPAPRSAASLAATSPNAVAYQFPGRPHTFFGQAVLEALSGLADRGDAKVDFRELVDYVRPRVNVLLQAAAGTALDQTVRPTIDGDEELVVTELPTPPAQAPMPPVPAPRGSAPPVPAPPAPTLPGAAPGAAGLGAAAGRALAARFDEALTVREPIPLEGLRASFGEAVRRFGHEYVSLAWFEGGVGLHSLGDGSALAGGATVVEVARDEASSRVRVDLLLAPHPHGVLLVFEGAHSVQRERLALALPTDEQGEVPIRLTLTLARVDRGGDPKLQKVEAWLGPAAANPHYDYLWRLTEEAEFGSLTRAAQRADAGRLQRAAQDKINGQAAATAGMLLLARAGQLARVGEWTRNLMNWFPQLPDGAVLWAESLRDAVARGERRPFGVDDPLDEMAAALETLWSRGLPFFADSVELADALLRHLLRAPIAEARRERLAELARWLERVFELAQPAGHFMALAGQPRPEWLAGVGALTVDEMLVLLRPGCLVGAP